MKVSVCIATVRPDTLADAVDAIRRQTYSNWELILVAQGNDPKLRGTCDDLTALDDRIRAVHLPTPGLSRARNRALELATGEICAFTDDDCEPRIDWLASIVAELAAHPRAGAVCGCLIAPEPARGGPSTCPSVIVSDRVLDPADPRSMEAGLELAAANFAIRRHIFATFGGYDECLGPGTRFASAEDIDYGIRLLDAGVPIVSSGRCVVAHTHGRRYGWKSLWNHHRSYVRGAGAVAAKREMTALNGASWLEEERRAPIRALSRFRIKAAVRAYIRAKIFHAAYHECLRDFTCHPHQRTLAPIVAGPA